MMGKRIIGLGNALADILTRIESEQILDSLGFGRGTMHLVHHAMHSRIEELTDRLHRTVVPGGSAANTMRGLGQLGVPCSYVGKVGRDPMGDSIRTQMAELGVIPQLIRSDTPTGRCMVLVSPDGERTMATFLGAATELTDSEITHEMFATYDILHIEGYLVQNHDLIRDAMRKAKSCGLKVSLDMASYNVVEESLDFLKELISEYVDLVFANEDEARVFTGKEPLEAVRELSERVETAVVKIGENGSLIGSGGRVIEIAAFPAEVVDTTGAGDLYASGFLYGLSVGLSLRECGEIGALMAAQVIETIGPALSPDRVRMIRNTLDGYCSL